MKKYQVFVRLKPGVLDVQGKAIAQGIHDFGFAGIEDVRVGKLIEIEVQNNDQGKEHIDKICREILSNPIIEDYEVREV